jgi:toxin FitB
MRYLLDTCVLSELVKPRPNRTVCDWVEQTDEESAYLSVLTLGEIQKGITKVKNSKRKVRLQQWLDADLRHRFKHRILPISDDVALTWGILQGETEQRGTPVSTIDGLLAATAIAHNLTLVTRNESDILPTGAHILNPWKLS